MVIKLKNKLWLVLWLLIFTFGLSGVLTAIADDRDFLQGDYFETNQFQYEYGQFIDYLSRFELNYKTPEQAKAELVVTPEEIEEHRTRFGSLSEQTDSIKGQYEQKIQEALQSGNKSVADAYTAERDKKIEDITNNFKSDEHVRPKVLKEKEAQLEQYYKELEQQRSEFEKYKLDFQYYLKDITTGQVFTNVKGSEVRLNKDTLFVHDYPSGKQGYLETSGNHEEVAYAGRSLAGRIAIVKPSAGQPTGIILGNYYDYYEQQKVFFVQAALALIALLLSLYLYKKYQPLAGLNVEQLRGYYNRIPSDVRVVGFAFTALITWVQLTHNNQLYLYPYIYSFVKATLRELIILSVFVSLTALQAKFLYERLKERSNWQPEWETAVVYRISKAIKDTFLIRSVGTKVWIILTLAFGFGLAISLVMMEPSIIVVYVPVFLVVAVPTLMFIVRRTGYFNQIVTSTNELVKGNLEQDLPIKGQSALADLAANINTLKHGVKASQREQAKSERLKTELITNVSHDLRTPLTSIITYTELLKTPELSEEDREAYVQIIDRKSKRLKVLIDDLFEASKMASGSIELVREKVDIVQLLQQALAEHNETVKDSGLQFRVSNPDKPVYATVDGPKIWRVFDNLIGNILKYALANTRVYITVQEQAGQVSISFKNVTKYELSQDIDELFERFKRGDTSRHTEGSGLGLAIAKSIVDLHGGSMEIEVDGDLFKVVVKL